MHVLDPGERPSLTYRPVSGAAGPFSHLGVPVKRRVALCGLVAAVAAIGCGSWGRVGGGEQQPRPSETLTDFLNVQNYYKRLGRLTAGAPVPFVGTVAFAAGTADTAIAIVALSLENRAFSFQKEGNSFAARYHVDISFARAGSPPISVGRDQLVRVPTFAETQRADESVLFQQVFRVTPGTYHVTVQLRDPTSGSSSRAELDYTAPSFTPGTTSQPILAYQVRGRANRSDTLAVVINPRGTVGYGGDTLLAYVEGYDFAHPTRVPFEVRTETDSVVYRDSLEFHGGHGVESQVLRLRPDSMALGELKLVVGQGSAARQASALVSFSTAWVVTNFDDMVSLLRYFGHQASLDSLRKASPAARPLLWRTFFRNTDPNPSTPENEALNAYFTRLAIANQRFRDEGASGWRTDRGEVFIALGEPDEIYETTPGAAGGRIVRWTYVNLRLTLYFVDETSFGRLRLDPSSRADFERVLGRIQRLAD